MQAPPCDHKMLAVAVFDENSRLSFAIVNGPLGPGQQTKAVMLFKHMLHSKKKTARESAKKATLKAQKRSGNARPKFALLFGRKKAPEENHTKKRNKTASTKAEKKRHNKGAFFPLCFLRKKGGGKSSYKGAFFAEKKRHEIAPTKAPFYSTRNCANKVLFIAEKKRLSPVPGPKLPTLS